MTGRYPRFVMEADRCVLKLWDQDAQADVTVCEVSASLALVLMRDLASIVGRMIASKGKL